MKIYYGLTNNCIDVTNICFEKLIRNNIITIPEGSNKRDNYFTDPMYGIHKNIIIDNNGIRTEYDEYTEVRINTINNYDLDDTIKNIHEKLKNIHDKLKINYGGFNEGMPEQKMIVRYLTGDRKVLEIGGNIGRNSLVIASILENNTNLVVLESDENIANQLIQNRDLNNFNFHVENSASLNRKLIQIDGEIMHDILQNNYKWINTVTLGDIKTKYNIEFDTLVVDCEGAFYYILMDTPEILNNINLIIMDNDYWDISKKNYVDNMLIKNNFYRDYVEAGGWGPCYDNFFEVWKKSFH